MGEGVEFGDARLSSVDFDGCLIADTLAALGGIPMLSRPVSVYVNWSAYDELGGQRPAHRGNRHDADAPPAAPARVGCAVDYYMMDCFWYARDTGYRSFRKPHFPNGPEAWLEACRSNGVLPGLWISTNALWAGLDCIPAWESSKDSTGTMLAFAQGGYLSHLIETLDYWYQRGVRAFKFDFADFSAATPDMLATMLPGEIRSANVLAFRSAMIRFRQSHPDCLLMAYNGFEDADIQSVTDQPLRKSVDTRWLDVFDCLYCGDPRPADVPCANFWRSKDIYTDHMVRVYEHSDLPLDRIDNAGFMIGTIHCCYGRGKAAWKAMLLLSLARGGHCNTYYGNLDLLTDDDAAWFAKAQRFFWPLLTRREIATTGALPGTGGVYGYRSTGAFGGQFTIWMNPSQQPRRVETPPGRVLYHDGTKLVRDGASIVLGAEQMVLIGHGAYDDPAWDFGTDESVVIPDSIERMDVRFEQTGHTLRGVVTPPAGKTLRILFQQFEPNGRAKRVTGGKPPKGSTLGSVLQIAATQDGKPVPLTLDYDKYIWCGISWGCALIDGSALPGAPIEIVCSTLDVARKRTDRLTLRCDVYAVR